MKNNNFQIEITKEECKPKCKYPGCNNYTRSLGYCNKHYKLFHRTGDIEYTISNTNGICYIDGCNNTIKANEDIPNILEEYGLKESECNYIVTEYSCKIINLTYEDKIVSKENKTQDNKVFI